MAGSITPTLVPLGDQGLLIRFGDALSDEANQAAIAVAARIAAAKVGGVVEVVPNLVSVLVRYDPRTIGLAQLAGEVRLNLSVVSGAAPGAEYEVVVAFDGPDVGEVSAMLGFTSEQFVTAHCRRTLRVLATGFAPGFVYCGMHPDELTVPRRAVVRRQVVAGTVLFAAGQTAITSTPIPTGWHVIGRTSFRNFDPATDPPSRVVAGDSLRFAVA